MIRKNIFTHFAKSRGLSFTEKHGEKMGGVSFFRSADAYKDCLNIINDFG